MSDVYSNLYINLNKDESIDKRYDMLDKLDKDKKYNSYFYFELHSNRIDIFLKFSDFNCYDIECLYKDIKKDFGKIIEGYIIVDGDGSSRGEFDENGNLQYADVNWLTRFTIKDIERLKNYAFGNEFQKENK